MDNLVFVDVICGVLVESVYWGSVVVCDNKGMFVCGIGDICVCVYLWFVIKVF